MPFKSEAQRKWMYANHPDMAKEWESHTPKGEKLPKRKKRRRKRRSKSVVLALWASKVTYDCLMECGDNIEAGLAAANIILSTEQMPEDFLINYPLAVDVYGHKPLSIDDDIKSGKLKSYHPDYSKARDLAERASFDAHRHSKWVKTLPGGGGLNEHIHTARLHNKASLLHEDASRIAEKHGHNQEAASHREQMFRHMKIERKHKPRPSEQRPRTAELESRETGSGAGGSQALAVDVHTHIPLGKETGDEETDEQFVKRTRGATKQQPASQPPQAHLNAVHNAVLKHEGGVNLAKLVHVRHELAAQGMTREQQDAAIHELRRQNHIQASGLEGRHGITPEERDAAIREGDNLLGHLLFVNPQAARARGVRLATEETPKNNTEPQQHTKTIEEFEHPDSESWSLPVEHVVLRAANGNHIHYAGNSANEVTLPQEHRHLLKDSVYTHNHPTGTNSLSVTDVNTAVHHNIAEMRAVAHNRNDNKRYVMSLGRPKSGWRPDMVAEYNQAAKKILNTPFHYPGAENDLSSYIARLHQHIADKHHEALTQLAQKYGATYERREVPPAVTKPALERDPPGNGG